MMAGRLISVVVVSVVASLGGASREAECLAEAERLTPHCPVARRALLARARMAEKPLAAGTTYVLQGKRGPRHPVVFDGRRLEEEEAARRLGMIKQRNQLDAALCTLATYRVPLFMVTHEMDEALQQKYCAHGVHVLDVGDFDMSQYFHPILNATRAKATGRSFSGILQPRRDGWLTCVPSFLPSFLSFFLSFFRGEPRPKHPRPASLRRRRAGTTSSSTGT